MLFRFVALSVILSASIHAAVTTDVLVYGATPGGFCAAIAAAREGASVVLLEPTQHVGGVNTGGLSFSDSNQTVRSTVMGLFDEWHRRIEEDYQSRNITLPYKVAEKDNAVWTYEPHVAMRVTHKMLDEAGVTVITAEPLQRVSKDGASISGLITAKEEYKAKTYIDATYEGDLMAAAGVSWVIGREGRKEYGESFAGKQYPKKPMQMSGLDANGNLLPLLSTKDAGPDEEGDRNVMVYSYRLCVTKEPSNRVPFPAPRQYDPNRFEAVRRYFAQEKRPHILWDIYELPGKKYDANNGIGKQFSMGIIGGGNDWCEADQAKRQEIWEYHKQYTIELYHFLTTDPSVPAYLRKELSLYGLCKDEFQGTDHWSPQLYVREGRRMKGVYVLTQKDILESPEKEDPIVVSSFPIDSHDCQRIGTGDQVINEGTIFPVRMPGRRHGYPYQIPYRSITPQKAECTNLLVPVALSSTHVALSSVRVEPTWMILGQSAGVAAALSSKKNVAVQDLPYDQLKTQLLAQHQVLDLPVLPPLPPRPEGPKSVDPKTLKGIILDDSEAQLTGEWAHSSGFKPYIGQGYLHDHASGNSGHKASFRFKVDKAGKHQVRMAYSPHPTRSTEVPLDFIVGGNTQTILVNQTEPLDPNSPFRTVGEIELPANQEVLVEIQNRQTNGFVILDAIQLLEPVP